MVLTFPDKKYPTVVLADGRFPANPVPLEILDKAERIIACDGSVTALLDYGREPDAIIGDLDSITEDLKGRFSNRLFQDTDQEHNDLTKTIHWCHKQGIKKLAILGATGKREDHTLGNISLLPDYSHLLDVVMITDWGWFTVIRESTSFQSYPGQQVSVFTMDNRQHVTFHNLRYPLEKARLLSWWMGTLNESLGESFRIETGNDSPVIVFRNY